MNDNFSKCSGELEIANLIEESVANAAQRRQQFTEDSLVDLTEEETVNIEGGLSLAPHIPITPIPIKPPIILGLIYPPHPFPIGIIIKDPILPKF